MFEPERDHLYHERGCQHFNKPCADPNSSHRDFFCDCHHFTKLAVLRNGTDIAWPTGYAAEEGREWRRTHNLVRTNTR